MAALAIALLVASATASSAADADLSRPGAGGAPTPVRVALYLVDLQEISGADQTYLADVVLRAEWSDPRLAGRWKGLHGMSLDDVWHPRLVLLNLRGASATLPQRVEVDSSGLVSYRQRWLGRFSARMDLRDFPRDRQSLRIQVVSMGHTQDDVALVIDSESLRSGRAAELSVTDWAVGPVRIESAGFEPAPGVKALAGVHLLWEARRYTGYYIVQVVLPLILIVLMGWTALWLDPSVVASRVSLSMTTMLTLIAYRFALGKSVPTLSYLTRFDYFMLASTVLIFTTLLLVATGACLVAKGRTSQVQRLDRWARAVFLPVFVVVFVLTWWG